jgi:rare lipoprotein A
MKQNSMAICAFAGTLLAFTVNAANSSPFHIHRGTHYSRGHVARLKTHAASYRSHSAAYRRRGVATAAHSTGNEKPALAKAAIAGGLMSGIASVYSGERTANGEFASAGGLTAAHRTLPFGTMVKVTNTGTGRSVVVRINDRGPFVRGRVIDLTPAGARALGMDGLAPVKLAVVGGRS